MPSNLRAYWNPITADNFAKICEHGYDTVAMFGVEKTSVAALEVYEPFLCLAEEYGLKAMVGSQPEILANSGWPIHLTWSVNDFETAYGDAYDVLEADSRVVGYYTESACLAGTQWLRAKTKKILTYDFYGQPIPSGDPPDFADVIALNDEVVFEVFNLVIAPQCVSDVAYLYALNPKLKVGVWDQTLNLWSYDYAFYWYNGTFGTPPQFHTVRNSN